MKHDDRISEEQLNAFIDGELDSKDRDRILQAINEDNELKAVACELRTVREMVRHAYDYQEQDHKPGRRQGSSLFIKAIAASVLLAFGGILGWASNDQTRHEQLQATFWDEQSSLQNASIVQASEERGIQKVLVHVNSSNLDKIKEALDTAEALLQTYADTDQAAEMEIMANAGGLDLLRTGHSPYSNRVQELQQRYVNLTFLACQTAMDRIKREQGIDVAKELLPGVEITPSALDQILDRLREGWVYIKA